KKAVSLNDQIRVVVAVPRLPVSVYEAIFTLNALESDWFKKEAQNFTPYEKAEEKKIRDEAIKALNNAKNTYFNNSKVYWFAKGGIEVPVNENKRHDIANWLMKEFYNGKRNTFGHNEFNKSHINLSGQVRVILKEAGDILCDLSKPMRINWTWAEKRGGTKYLRKCFVEHQVLRISKIDGDDRYLETEKDIAKFRNTFPAYTHLLESLATLEGKGEVNVLQFLEPYFEEFGQGEIAVTLMLLLARRFYGDGLRLKQNSNSLADIQINNTEDMLALIQGKSPSAVILFEPVSKEEQMFFAKVTQNFSNQPEPVGKTYTIGEAFQAAVSWWDSLPNIARSISLYSNDNKKLAEVFCGAKTIEPFQFIKHELLEMLDQAPSEVLTPAKLDKIEELLKDFKQTAESIQATVEEEILMKVAEVFNSPSQLDVDIQEAFKNWYTGLNSIQKDPVSTFHNNFSKPLVKFNSYTNIRELLFKTLPEAYSIGRVENWNTNYTEDYIQRIRNGKSHIETEAPQISQLDLDFENDLSRNGNQVIYQGKLIIRADTKDGKGVIYYTIDGSDPINSLSKKSILPGNTITIQGNHKVKFVVSDEKGNYGAPKTIETINDLEKYKIIRPNQKSNVNETIAFVFPTSKEAARITLHSLLKELHHSGFYNADELRHEIQRILDEIT
ncbi:MAG: chitobiase/beta-hexosaminidase C-terminal domain-containing protein, partial [Fervidobacterium sp.]